MPAQNPFLQAVAEALLAGAFDVPSLAAAVWAGRRYAEELDAHRNRYGARQIRGKDEAALQHAHHDQRQVLVVARDGGTELTYSVCDFFGAQKRDDAVAQKCLAGNIPQAPRARENPRPVAVTNDVERPSVSHRIDPSWSVR